MGPITFETARVVMGDEPEDPTARWEFDYETVQLDKQGTVVAREQRRGWGYVEVEQGLRLEMVAIPGGEFLMGSPKEEPERFDDEGPQHQHRVTVPPFFMGRYAVTQAQWRVVAGWQRVAKDLEPDPSRDKGESRPVTNVSWEDAAEFCARLSRETGRDYGLPSEAMWEYACRAGTEMAFSFGEMISPMVANYDWTKAYDGVKFEAKPVNATMPVGSFPANPWGLQEMHGNVGEWCLESLALLQ